jgi:hypothetical protein
MNGTITPDEAYRAVLGAALDVALGDGDRGTAADLFDELVERREPHFDREIVAEALAKQVDYDLAVIFIAAGNRGLSPREVWAQCGTELALDDAFEGD